MSAESEAAANKGGSVKWARASVMLGILSFILFCASALFIKSWSLWRLPFVFGLFPVSVLKYAVIRLMALLAAITAVATGVFSIRRRTRILLALFGTVAGCLTIALTGVLAYSYFSTVRDDVDLTACGKNLNHLSRDVLWSYTGNAGGFYPPLSSQPGVLMFSPKAIPSDETVGASLTCTTMRKAKTATTGPASPFDDQSYFYLGYAVQSDDDVETFAQAYRDQIAAGGVFESDLTVKTPEGTSVLHRLRADGPVNAEGQGKTPVFIERGCGHVRIETVNGRKVRVHGGRVVYMNGANRFVPQGTWPMTERTQRVLAEIAR